MYKIFLILSVFFVACSNDTTHPEAVPEQSEAPHSTSDHAATLQLNEGAKWKADAPTRANVDALVRIVNDSSNTGISNQARLAGQMQTQIDTLVQQCKMKGADHDALHVWLEQVLRDLKQVKAAGEQDYETAYASLKKSVERFYDYFA